MGGCCSSLSADVFGVVLSHLSEANTIVENRNEICHTEKAFVSQDCLGQSAWLGALDVCGDGGQYKASVHNMAVVQKASEALNLLQNARTHEKSRFVYFASEASFRSQDKRKVVLHHSSGVGSCVWGRVSTEDSSVTNT